MRHSRGFTLVELLIVVVVVATLIAMLLPALSGGREVARRSVCASQQHQIGLGVTLYAHDFRGFYPPQVKEFCDSVWESWHAGPFLRDRISDPVRGRYRYVSNTRAYYCPSMYRNKRNRESFTPPNTDTFATWVNGSTYQYSSYAVLAGLAWAGPRSGATTINWWYMADNATPYPSPKHVNDSRVNPTLLYDFNESWPAGATGTSTEPYWINHLGANRLVAGANSVYMDLHAEWHSRPLSMNLYRRHYATAAWMAYNFW